MGRVNTRSSVASTLDIQSIGAKAVTYGEIDDPDMRDFNPSIAFDNKGDLKIALRRCNFAVERGGKWYLRDGSAYSRTDVMYGDLNPDTLEVSNIKKLELSDKSPTRTKVSGLEDVRLFARKDGIHAIGFECDRITKSLHNGSAKLAEYLIKGNELRYIRTLEKPDKEVVEKNWQPFDHQSTFAEFTYSPTQIYLNGHVIGDKYIGKIHGGTQLLAQEDGTYISLLHEKITLPAQRFVYDRYKYIHYLATHDNTGVVTSLSQPFDFGTHENIEFAAGMVEYGDDLIISLGIRDCKYAIVKINKKVLIDRTKSVLVHRGVDNLTPAVAI